MLRNIKEGIYRGIGLLVVLGTAVFAVSVTGTIKTWSSGETLTATDLNTTVQSLKTAVESATQLVEFGRIRNTETYETYYGTLTSGTTASAAVASTMTRSGTIKNAKLMIYGTMPFGCVMTLTKNGSDTAISMSAANGAGASTITDADTVTFIAGDTLGWKNYCAGSNGNTAIVPMIVSFEF
ncbi:MAG TPA: hypothetical protein PLF85_15685 [Turneriella sp.]|nr:hypothetical protein [Turneriella sp.]